MFVGPSYSSFSAHHQSLRRDCHVLPTYSVQPASSVRPVQPTSSPRPTTDDCSCQSTSPATPVHPTQPLLTVRPMLHLPHLLVLVDRLSLAYQLGPPSVLVPHALGFHLIRPISVHMHVHTGLAHLSAPPHLCLFQEGENTISFCKMVFSCTLWPFGALCFTSLLVLS